ncbi:MAG: LexA family protein [Candidatus Dojkabacteria bacterium]
MKITSIHPIKKSKVALPIYLESIKAGFPSPADDFIDKKLDLNDLLIKHPVATFFVRVAGDSMIGAGIHSGDILVVDRALEAVNNNIVVAVINGELTVKRLRTTKGKVVLMPENTNYKPIEIKEDDNFSIWGVVTTVIHRV